MRKNTRSCEGGWQILGGGFDSGVWAASQHLYKIWQDYGWVGPAETREGWTGRQKDKGGDKWRLERDCHEGRVWSLATGLERI